MQDPYSVLGVRRGAPEAEVRSAYRRLVKLHHPDHNNGSAESARRFEEVQEAYAEIQRRRGTGGTGGTRGARATRTRTPPPPSADPRLEDRLAALEHQVQQARRARDRAEAAAREAAHAAREAAERIRDASGPDEARERPSDEELGYVTTDDTIGKILSDARTQLSDRYGKVRQHPVAKRVSDLIDGLEELTEKLDRPPKGGKRKR
jgi:pyruvate/2-oxoglutarate dehydrogenase complex dihydrolipoamide acyltransferase (E2) component